MKTLITLFFLIVVTTFSCAQNSWTTQITPNNSVEYATKLIKTQDGGYVTVLNRVDTMVNSSANIEYNKIAIVKLDANGNIAFNKTINVKDSSLVRVNDFIELPTGDLLLIGFITTITSNDTLGGVLHIKTNVLGDTLWSKVRYNRFGTGYYDDNLVGFATKFWTLEGGAYNKFIYEYDYNGNLLNINYQDTMASNIIEPRLFKDINDTVIVSAYWKNEGYLYKKMDVLYNKHYSAYYPYSTIDTAYKTLAVQQNGDIALHSHSQGNTQLYINNGQFESITLQTYNEYEITWGAGTDQWGTNICATSDGGYAIIGDTWNGIADNIYLIKTDALGNKEFGKMYWAVTSNNIDVVQANDGGYVMLQAGAGVWVVKARIDGTIGVAENNYFAKHEVKIYPNPTTNHITLAFDQLTSGQIHLFNLTGQQVLIEQITQTKTHQISVADLPKGVYFVAIKTENTTITKKIIKN